MAESASTCRQADRINLDDLRAALDRPLKRLTCPHLLLFPLLACCWLFSTNGFVDIFTMQPVDLDDCYCDSHALPLAFWTNWTPRSEAGWRGGLGSFS